MTQRISGDTEDLPEGWTVDEDNWGARPVKPTDERRLAESPPPCLLAHLHRGQHGLRPYRPGSALHGRHRMSRSCYRMLDGGWDRTYVRVTAIYRLMKHGHITTERAKELAERPIRGVYTRPGWLNNTIEIWARALARQAAA